MTALATLVGRAARHSVLYGLARVSTVLVGIGALVVYTRLMPPSEFGVVAVLLTLSGLLTLLLTVGLLQGVLGAVFRQTEDEEGGGDALDDEEEIDPSIPKAEMLGTGVLLIAMVATVGTVAALLAAPVIGRAFLDDPRRVLDLRLAILGGGLGAVYRFLSIVPRLERRPRAYVGLQIARPALTLAAAVPFVVHSHGARGVMYGLVIATVVSIVASALVVRRSVVLRCRWGVILVVLKLIPKLGAVFVPLAGSLWVLQNAGLLILTRYVSNIEIGYYRVASVFALLMVQATAVFFMAWNPLKRTSAARAAHKERGQGAISSALATWLSITMVSLLVIIVAGAHVLVRLSGPAYAPAAKLIPILGVAALAHVMFVASYRIVTFPRKRLALAIVPVVAAALYALVATRLIPSLGVRGAPVAATIAFGLSAIIMLGLGQRGSMPIPYQSGRLLRLYGLAAACLVTHALVRRSLTDADPLLDASLVVAYFVLLVLLRVVPPQQARTLGRVGLDLLRPAKRRRLELTLRLAALPPRDAQVLRRALGPDRCAEGESLSPTVFVAALRSVSDAGAAADEDLEIGRYLLSTVSRAERDVMARALWRLRVDAAELDRLEDAVETLKDMPRRTWRKVGAGPVKPRSELGSSAPAFRPRSPRRGVIPALGFGLAVAAAVAVVGTATRTADPESLTKATNDAFAATTALSDALRVMRPGSSRDPARTLARQAARSVDAAGVRVGDLSGSSDMPLRRRVLGTLRADAAWIDAVGSTLANPRSLRRADLAVLAERAAGATAQIAGDVEGAKDSVGGTGRLLSATKAA